MAINAPKNRIKSFKKIGNDSLVIKQVQENVDQALTPIIKCPIIDGNLVTNVSLVVSKSNEILHGLGRKPRGFMIVRKRADSRIWDLQDTNPQPSRTFSLACSHNVTVDIWFF